MEILSTKNYDQFKLIASNREVNKGHVNKLMQDISKKNLLHVNPILVNTNNELIDGQHRLEAAKGLGVDIYYQVSDDVTREDISRLNSNKKNWNLSDYLNFHTLEGSMEYKAISSFAKGNPDIPLTACLQLLTTNGGSSSMLNDFKEGIFKADAVDRANTIAKQIARLSEYGKFVNGANFVRSYIQMHRHEKFDFDKLLYQIQKSPRSFVQCLNNKQYLEMFNEIYNRHAREGYKLDFIIK